MSNRATWVPRLATTLSKEEADSICVVIMLHCQVRIECPAVALLCRLGDVLSEQNSEMSGMLRIVRSGHCQSHVYVHVLTVVRDAPWHGQLRSRSGQSLPAKSECEGSMDARPANGRPKPYTIYLGTLAARAECEDKTRAF